MDRDYKYSSVFTAEAEYHLDLIRATKGAHTALAWGMKKSV
jgi:hypothetical protein